MQAAYLFSYSQHGPSSSFGTQDGIFRVCCIMFTNQHYRHVLHMPFFCLMCNRRPMSLCDVPNKDISISISSSGCNLIGNWNWDGHSFFETLAPSFRDSCLSPLGGGTNSTVPANNLSICLEAARTAQNQIDRETWAVDLMQLLLAHRDKRIVVLINGCDGDVVLKSVTEPA